MNNFHFILYLILKLKINCCCLKAFLGKFPWNVIVLYFRTGAFFFIIMNMVFGNLSAVELFIKNRAIFLYVIAIILEQ